MDNDQRLEPVTGTRNTPSENSEELQTFYREIGQKIREARSQKGLTQTKLGAYLGFSPAAMNNYESGIRQISVHSLVSVAKATGKQLHYFLPEMEPKMLVKQIIVEALSNLLEDTVYLDCTHEMNEADQIYRLSPAPVLPFPKELGVADFVIRRKCGEAPPTYFFCSYFKAHGRRKQGLLPLSKTIRFLKRPSEDSLVIAEETESEDFDPKNLRLNLRLCRFREVKPAKNLPSLEREDPRLINVHSLVVAILERQAE